MEISAIVLTKNEEKNIEACLKTLHWCDEIIIIDDSSIDETVTLAKKQGAKVYSRNLEGNFAAQRNYGLEKARNEWVLFVDADERVSKALVLEISNFRPKSISHSKEAKFQILNNLNGFYVKRVDSMWGKVLQYGETGNIRLLRLAKKSAGKWKGNIHEVWEVLGEVVALDEPLQHFPHQTVSEFLSEINFYTTLRARELFNQKISVSWVDIILYPKAKFFVNYFVKQGFRDGIPGLVCAMVMSLHSFLVRGKLWQLWQEK